MSQDMMIKMIFAIVIVCLLLLIIDIIKDAYRSHVAAKQQRRAEDIRAKKDK